MEEAEALCDRLGIMALGELQCIGTAAQLKQRFGIGYTFFMATQGVHEDHLVEFVDKLFGKGNSKILGHPIGGVCKFEVKREAVVLSQVFTRMESPEVKAELGLLDWSLTETTLEEVFLKLADLAHVDEALSKKPKESKSCLDKIWGGSKNENSDSKAAVEDAVVIKNEPEDKV